MKQGRVLILLTVMLGCFGLVSPDNVQAWPTKYTSCSSCHSATEATATVDVAIDAVQTTSVTVAPGGSFEIDFIVRNIAFSGVLGLEVAVPTGWTIGTGTVNTPPLTGWNAAWEQTSGVTAGWATADMYSTATQFPNSQDGYTINFDTSGWDSGNRNAAFDDASGGDLDGTANTMGSDVIVNVPGGATAGTYFIQVTGAGHNSSPTKGYVTQQITVTVSTGASAPTLTTPTATSITATGATLGANITSDGGDTITARGTCWDTTATPRSSCLAEGGTATGVFTQGRSGFPSQNRIFYAGYATNGTGTGYSSDGSFYTEPATQASGVGFNTVTGTDMNVTWTRGSGNEVIVLAKQGAAVDANPVDGTYTGYTANGSFGSGTQIGTGNYVVYRGTGTSVAVSGLSNSTTYHFAVYELAGAVDTAGDAQGTNYLQAAPATGSQATSGANSAPNVPANPTFDQFKSDNVTPIVQGTYTDESTIIFKATLTDPDTDDVRLQVEYQPVASAFTGTASCTGSFVTSGSVATVTCAAIPVGEYKWQAQAEDVNSAVSGWAAY